MWSCDHAPFSSREETLALISFWCEATFQHRFENATKRWSRIVYQVYNIWEGWCFTDAQAMRLNTQILQVAAVKHLFFFFFPPPPPPHVEKHRHVHQDGTKMTREMKKMDACHTLWLLFFCIVLLNTQVRRKYNLLETHFSCGNFIETGVCAGPINGCVESYGHAES